MLLEGGEGGEGAGAVAGVAAGDVVEFVEGFGDSAEGESGRCAGRMGEGVAEVGVEEETDELEEQDAEAEIA